MKKTFHQFYANQFKFSPKILTLLVLFITFSSCEVNENIIEEDSKMSTENISKQQLLSELNNQTLKEYVSNNSYSEKQHTIIKNSILF